MSTIVDMLKGSLSVTESGGLIEEVRRSVLVTGNWSDVPAAANAILTDPSMPAVGSMLTINGQKVYLEDRDVQIIDSTDATVDLIYKRRDDPTDLRYRVGTALEQVSTQLDRNGDPITVEHNGVTQGGEISVDDARTVLETEFVSQSSAPGTVVQTWSNKVNSTPWMAGAAGEWRVSDCSADLVDINTTPSPTYRFRFQFTYKAGGWQPGVAFVDPETGNPPPGLVDGTGYKTVDHYFEIDFNTIF